MSNKILQYQFELKTGLQYTSCFCEENVYLLAKKCITIDATTKCESFVVFISSRSKQTPIWCQKSGRSNESPVVWDYHVVLLVRENSCDANNPNSVIFDIDSTLPFPCRAAKYFVQSFKPQYFLPEEHQQ